MPSPLSNDVEYTGICVFKEIHSRKYSFKTDIRHSRIRKGYDINIKIK